MESGRICEGVTAKMRCAIQRKESLQRRSPWPGLARAKTVILVQNDKFRNRKRGIHRMRREGDGGRGPSDRYEKVLNKNPIRPSGGSAKRRKQKGDPRRVQSFTSKKKVKNRASSVIGGVTEGNREEECRTRGMVEKPPEPAKRRWMEGPTMPMARQKKRKGGGFIGTPRTAAEGP